MDNPGEHWFIQKIFMLGDTQKPWSMDDIMVGDPMQPWFIEAI